MGAQRHFAGDRATGVKRLPLFPNVPGRRSRAAGYAAELRYNLFGAPLSTEVIAKLGTALNNALAKGGNPEAARRRRH